MTQRARFWQTFGLWLLILLGIGCRFAGLNWDNGTLLHPDERFLFQMVSKMRWPDTPTEYFHTARSPLSPFNHEAGFFVYGQLPLLILKATADVLYPGSAQHLALTGRFLSALFDSGTVLLLWLIGRRLHRPRLGLLAAALLGVTALHIQHAHFFVVDTFATFFLTATFWAMLVYVSSAKTRDNRTIFPAALTGVLWGAALACKISSLLFAPVLLWFLAAHWRRHATWRQTLGAALLIFGAAFIVFRVAHPLLFRGEGGVATLWGLLDIRLWMEPKKSFWASLQYQSALSRGDEYPPWNLQWIGRADYWWPARNLALWAVGWPLLGTAVGGTLLAVYRLARRRAVSAALVAAALWPPLIFFYYAGWYSKFTRYYLAITPLLALCAAWLLAELWREAGARHTTRWFAASLVAGVLGLTTLWALAVTSIYLRPHSRIAASQWMRDHIAPGSIVAVESSEWDDVLPLDRASQDRLGLIDLELYSPESAEKRRLLLDDLDDAEWIVISSNRLWATIPRLPQLYPLTTAFYTSLFNGGLGFQPVQEFTSYPQLSLFGRSVQFADDDVEEALTVYDHPRVVLFRKTPAYSRRFAESILHPSLLDRMTNRGFPAIRDDGWRPDESKLPQLPSAPPVAAPP